MFTRVLLAAALAVATTGGAQAATLLNFSFTFSNPLSNGGGTVTGIVRGLVDNDAGPATSVEVLTNTLDFGIGEYVGDPDTNSFTVSGGAITQAAFSSFGMNSLGSAVTTSSLFLGLAFPGFPPEATLAGLTNNPSTVNVGVSTRILFTRVDVTPIPVPAALPLLLGGVGAIAFAGRRRARRSAAPA